MSEILLKKNIKTIFNLTSIILNMRDMNQKYFKYKIQS